MVALHAFVKRFALEIGDFCLKRGYVALTIIANLTVACATVNDEFTKPQNLADYLSKNLPARSPVNLPEQ